MPLTFTCLAVIAASLAVIGVPLQWLLNGRRPLSETDWCLVPFLGLAGIVLPVQNLVYLDVPIARLSVPLWIAGVVSMAWLLLTGRLRGSVLPWRPFAVAAAVFAVHGLGLFLLGARTYVGRAWTDQFNYSAAAEFLMHSPYHTPVEKVITHPWLAWVWTGKEDRIGQTMLQGFWAVSSGASAKALFCPTILLTAPLCMLAVYLLGRRLGLGRNAALLAGAAAGLMPGVATIHLDCFLSQAFGVPLLLLFGLLLADVAWRPYVGRVARAGLTLTLALSVYTEFTPLLGGLLAMALAYALLRRRPAWRQAGAYLIVLLSPLLLNPYFTAMRWWTVLSRFDAPMLAFIYPWAQTLEGWGRPWLGDLAWGQRGSHAGLRVYTIAMTVLAYLGLAVAAWRHRPWERRWQPRSFPLAAGLLGIALLPLAVILKDTVHPYQVQKLLHTASPLGALGVCLAGRWLGALARRKGWHVAVPGALACAPLTIVLVLASRGTVQMVWASSLRPERSRSWASILASPELLQMQELLEATRKQKVLIAHDDVFQRSWLAYFARHNRTWVSVPTINDASLTGLPRADELLRFDPPASDLFIVTAPARPFVAVDPGDARRTWCGTTLQLWQTRSAAWGLPVCMINPLGLEPANDEVETWTGVQRAPSEIAPREQADFWISRRPTAMGVIAGCAGRLILSGVFRPGPSLPEHTLRRLEVRTSEGYVTQWSTNGGAGRLEIPVPAGSSTIWLRSLDFPTVRPRPDGPSHAPLLGVKDLCASFRAWGDPSRDEGNADCGALRQQATDARAAGTAGRQGTDDCR